jgi:copper chaperone CopZ
MEKLTVPVKGMHCASCATTIEKSLSKMAGVKTVAANFGTETAEIGGCF